MSGTKIAARGIERVFQGTGRRADVTAIDDFSLDIDDAEFVSLIGPSGCGKSTFLRIVAGLLRPTSGALHLEHVEQDRPLCATVFQEYSIFPWKTVAQNVRFGLEMIGVPKNEARERVGSWIARVGLTGFDDAYPRFLSGGMKQRVALARAMVVEPEILLMDEPFAALDAQLRSILQEELLRIWEHERRTVLFVTHSLEEAILLSDRVILMTARPGRFKADFVIDLPRPRSGEVRSSPEFADIKARIWSELEEEVRGALKEGASK